MPLRRHAAAAATLAAILGLAATAGGDEPTTRTRSAGGADPATTAPAFTLGRLTAMALDRNPRLAQAAFAVDAARGRAVQAGLYPNPTLEITGDELGDRQGPAGIITAPRISQEIVVGGKRRLSQAAAAREVDQAGLALMSRRYALLADVRQAYFDVATLERRAAILRDLVKLAEESVARTNKLLEAKQVSRLDLTQLEVEVERFRAEIAAAERELPPAYKRLAAVVGLPILQIQGLGAEPEPGLPAYDLEAAQAFVVANHPEAKAAATGVERARLLLARAKAEPIPNPTVSAGYVRQNQNRSNDWLLGVTLPIPAWNRNQGNIRAAQAGIGEAQQELLRVENDLAERLASSFREFAAAGERAERYATRLLPRARESYELAAKAYQAGRFDYLRLLEAQRSVAQARLEVVRARGEAWKAAAAISGLTLEEEWPPGAGVAEGAAVPSPNHAP